MTECSTPEVEFPTEYTFKAFGLAEKEEEFIKAVKQAVNNSVTCSDDAIHIRESSGGKYVCVSAMAYLTGKEQLYAVYRDLKAIDGLMFLL
ncbi:MAG: hypothetical protein C0615_01205 [Desulfuromonas sp.]|nr:MAG: hypothetical protein C0615_01205 [Desulfuromonas sp.]